MEQSTLTFAAPAKTGRSAQSTVCSEIKSLFFSVFCGFFKIFTEFKRMIGNFVF